MNAMTHKEYLKSEEWSKLRIVALERDGYRCRVCNSSEGLNVHHRKYPTERNQWESDCLDSLTTLCRKCHNHFHKGDKSEDTTVGTDEINTEIAHNVCNFITNGLETELEQSMECAKTIYSLISDGIEYLYLGPLKKEHLDKTQKLTPRAFRKQKLNNAKNLCILLIKVLKDIDRISYEMDSIDEIDSIECQDIIPLLYNREIINDGMNDNEITIPKYTITLI